MLKIGWAQREFTPQRPAMIQGQRHRRVGRAAADPLTLTALALESETDGDCAIIISCDLAFTPASLWREVRQELSVVLPSFNTDKLIMNATHTHDSLVLEEGYYEHPGPEVMNPVECRRLVARRAVEAAAEAWENRAPQKIGRAFGHAVVGHNRLAVYADGHAEMYGDTARPEFSHIGGYEDHSLDMLFTWSPEGTLTGIAPAIPAPAQVTESLEVFSADYWHEVRLELRRMLGAGVSVLPLCAPAGDQSPHLLLYRNEEAEARRRRGVTERQEIALRVADAVQRELAVATAWPQEELAFAHILRRMELPPRAISRQERDRAEREYREWVARTGESVSWTPQRRLAVVETFDGKRKPEAVPVEIHVLRIGDLAVATNPFELFLDYGLRIKARSPAAQTMLVQLAGRGMYLPTKRAVAGGGYGAIPEVSLVGPEGGAILVEETLRLIGELFPA